MVSAQDIDFSFPFRAFVRKRSHWLRQPKFFVIIGQIAAVGPDKSKPYNNEETKITFEEDSYHAIKRFGILLEKSSTSIGAPYFG